MSESTPRRRTRAQARREEEEESARKAKAKPEKKGAAAVVEDDDDDVDNAPKNNGSKAAAKGNAALTPEETKKREQQWQKIRKRAVFGFSMIGAFLSVVAAGHLYVAAMVLMIQCALYLELVNVRYDATRELEIPLFRTTQWGWFTVAIFYTYGEWLRDFAFSKPGLHWLLPVLRYHGAVAFVLFSGVLVGTIATLKRKLIRYQVSHLSWSVTSIVLIVAQLKGTVSNIFNGLFWFMMPAAAVVANDTFAYVCGVTFGKKFVKQPFLPTLSPNKTWEGFVGASFMTLVFCYFFAQFLARFDLMSCPVDNLYFTPRLFDSRDHLDCTDNYTLRLDQKVNVLGVSLSLPAAHGLVIGLVASLIAPWGGFLASAIKRAYDIKDFGTLIPGHGGVMDRMDCQLLIMMAAYVHFRPFHAPRLAAWPPAT
mmetsp:Transcript_10244/g.30573  ORF Transcript_10244/g.30573 Transcript_10244/m.30573 type:complete len:424 (-) Transcript_10244:1367-2638(-)